MIRLFLYRVSCLIKNKTFQFFMFCTKIFLQVHVVNENMGSNVLVVYILVSTKNKSQFLRNCEVKHLYLYSLRVFTVDLSNESV